MVGRILGALRITQHMPTVILLRQSLLMDQVPVFLPMEPRSVPYGRPLLRGHDVIVIIIVVMSRGNHQGMRKNVPSKMQGRKRRNQRHKHGRRRYINRISPLQGLC